MEDFGAGVLRGFEEVADNAAGDADGSFLGETLAGEDGGGGGLGGEGRGCAEDGFADGEVDLDGIDSGGERGADEVFVAKDRGGGVVAAELVDLALELRGLGDLGLDGGL